MSTIDASELLRPGLLDGVSLLVAGAAVPPDLDAELERSPSVAIAAACERLGARVSVCALTTEQALSGDDATVAEVVAEAVAGADVRMLAIDAAGLFASALAREPADVRTALRACMDGAWTVTRAVAESAFLVDGRGGRIVYVAPFADAGEYADAARAGLENLARTLSIEWARHGVTAVAIAPGARASVVDAQAAGSAASEVAALIAYLASPAGSYFSGCLLDLRGPSPFGNSLSHHR